MAWPSTPCMTCGRSRPRLANRDRFLMISLLEDLAGMLGRPVSASGRALLMDITDPEGKALARFRTAVGDISVFSDRLSETGAVGVVPAKAVPVARQPFIIDFVENDSTDGISGNAERLERL